MNDHPPSPPSRKIDMPDVSIPQQALGAEVALSRYCEIQRDFEYKTPMSGLLCAIMHLCDRDGLAFDSVLAAATESYVDQTEPAPKAKTAFRVEFVSPKTAGWMDWAAFNALEAGIEAQIYQSRILAVDPAAITVTSINPVVAVRT